MWRSLASSLFAGLRRSLAGDLIDAEVVRGRRPTGRSAEFAEVALLRTGHGRNMANFYMIKFTGSV